MTAPRWGITATVKAPLGAIRRFAAWHLEQGAARLILWLDDGDADKAAALNAHPAIRAIATGDAHWQARGRRPGKHQVRQSVNATEAAADARDLAWLFHVDVDEFLIPRDGGRVADQLAALPPDALCARVRPAEALAADPETPRAPDSVAFKAFEPDAAERRAAARACFGGWGDALAGGFLSHVAGKLAIRPAAAEWRLRIHNVEGDGVQNPGEAALPALALGHVHAPDFEAFRAHLGFRLKRGSYRAELNPSIRQPGAPTTHDLLSRIRDRDGMDGLRAFYRDVNTATPGLLTRLAEHGLLVEAQMPLDALVARHFAGDAASGPNAAKPD